MKVCRTEQPYNHDAAQKTLCSYQASGFSFLLFCALSQDAVGSWHLRISKRVVFMGRCVLTSRAFGGGAMKTVTSENTSAHLQQSSVAIGKRGSLPP